MTQHKEIYLPKGWELTEVSSIVSESNTGLVRSAKEQFIEGAYPYVKMNNLSSSGQFDLTKIVYVDAADKDLIKGQLRNGDFVFNTRNSLELVGKCGVFNKKSDSPILFNNNLLRMRFSDVMPEIVAFWLNSPLGKQQLNSVISATTNVAAIYQKSLFRLHLPIPPLPEQKRIVEKLDSLLAQVDTIQQRLNNLPDIIKRFRQSVLAAAVSGKLTEQWRVGNEVTDVEDSIKEILNDRSVKVTARTKFPQPHLKDEEYPIPDNWKWVSLDSLASKIVDGVHHKPVYTEEGVPFMSVKDIKNGKMTFDFCKYISQETHKEIHPRCNPEKGDLLITKSGTIGRTAIVETDDIFDLFVSVALIKPASSEVNMHFVDLALRKWVNGIDISSRVVGTAIKNLHLRDMRVLAIPFAPIEEQTEIVRLVEQYFALADTLEKNLVNAKQRVDNLTQSILAKAFRGELVPQDPNDEPADKLLARIKAARLEAEKLEKAAKKAAKASKK